MSKLNAARLLQCLERQESLCELHTHLLGMGNASFWVQSILADPIKLPTQEDYIKDADFRIRLGPLVWDEKNKLFIDRAETQRFFDQLVGGCDLKQLLKFNYDAVLNNLVSDKFSQELAHRDLSFKKNFSYDVVLSLDDLAKGLGIEKTQPRDMKQAMVEEKLGVYTRSDWQTCKFFEDWIIFDARIQELKIVDGMQAKYLRELIGGAKSIQQLTDPAQRDARAHIINAFSMMNADGSEPRSVDFHSFRGAFTPEFYPRRFSLKDSIYSQRLDLLAFLLRNTLHRFSTCLPPIKYCEFSISCSDLSRPWVFDVLSTFSNVNKFGKFKTLVDQDDFPWLKTNGFEQTIAYRFLAGFKRRIERVSNAYSPNEAVEFLFEVPHYAIHVMLREFYNSDNQRPTILFTDQVKQLQKLKKEAKVNPADFFHWVVGLDLFGDELGYPYCPFVAYEFLQFLQDANKQNSAFGIRIHCAENVPFVRPELPGYRLFSAHMYIIYRCLDFLKQKLGSNIRVGHGIAFDKLLSIKNYRFRKSSVLVAEIQENAKLLLPSIPFEVNITSNFYLLGDAIRNVENARPLSSLYNIDVPVVLSTDNDGIWPIDKCSLGHEAHHSLAAEYCRAITTRFITTEDQLKNMVQNAKRFCFDNKGASARDKPSKPRIDINTRTGNYFSTDVIVHPKVLHMLFDRLPPSAIDSCLCLKYYKDIYGLQTTSEHENEDKDWKNHCELMGPVVVACFYLKRLLPYAQFETEYNILFDPHFCKEMYRACENVFSQLMNDTPGQGAHMLISVDRDDYLFCSEVPDNRKCVPEFLLNTIKKYITRVTKTTVFSFLPNIDSDNAKITSDLQNIDKQIINRDITIFIHTNTTKSLLLLENISGKLLINSKPRQRTGPKQEKIECALYAVCPHGSVATAALHFIAKHIRAKSFSIEPQHVSLRALVIPFLPLRFGFPTTSNDESKEEHKKRFLELYSITGTELAEKVVVEKELTCRALHSSEYNVLCSDVRYAEQIETKYLIEKIRGAEFSVKSKIPTPPPGAHEEDSAPLEKICINYDELLEILYKLCESIDKFNLWSSSFVLLENVKEYESYKKSNNIDKIALPIIPLGKKFLICSSTDFVEKNELKTPAYRLWSLAVCWKPPLSHKHNSYEHPYSEWIKSIVKIGSQKLNTRFGGDTWESFLRIVLLDAGKQAWFWYTVSRWCAVIEDAFSTEPDLMAFIEFLKKKQNTAKKFIALLDDSNRHKLGNTWQKDIIKNHKANEYLEKIRNSVNVTS